MRKHAGVNATFHLELRSWEKPMARVHELFVTQIYREELQRGAASALLGDLRRAAQEISAADRAGQAWSKAHDYPGYTSMRRSTTCP